MTVTIDVVETTPSKWRARIVEEGIEAEGYQFDKVLTDCYKEFVKRQGNEFIPYPEKLYLTRRVKELEMAMKLERIPGKPSCPGYYWIANEWNPIGCRGWVGEEFLKNGKGWLWHAIFPGSSTVE